MKKLIVVCLMLLAFQAQSQISYPSVSKGLKFEAEDKSALIKMNFRSQSLVTLTDDGEDQELTAMIRRMRLKFGGYLLDPSLEYKLELGFSNRDIGNGRDAAQVGQAPKVILDAVFKYHMDEHSELWFGQTKLPGNRERVISSQALQFVDRSLVNSRFNIDRDFGVQFRYNNAVGGMPVEIAAALTTGEGRNITVVNEGGYNYVGRLEVYPLGEFSKDGAYFGADLQREETPKLAIGATYNFNQQTDRTQGQLGSFVYALDTLGEVTKNYAFNDLTTVFVDMMFKYQGWSVMSEFAQRTMSTADTMVSSRYSEGQGFVAQVGYLFPNNYEVGARYTTVDLTEAMGTLKNTEEYTVSLSKYIVGHKIKWQADVSMTNDEEMRYRFQLEFGI